MTTCEIEECGRRAHARGLCGMHYSRFWRHGDPLRVVPIEGRPLSGEVPTITAVHKRLLRKHGRAATYRCVDCGDVARDWSYNNADPDELFGMIRGTRVAYSLNPANYAPRCVSCHRKFDGAGSRDRDAGGKFVARTSATQITNERKVS